MSARDRIAPVFDLAPFIHLIGYKLVDAGEGWVETALTLEERHLQQHGYAHAGVVTAMADHTAGGAASTVVQPGNSVLTAMLSIQLLRPARGERLTCRGEVVKPGKRIIATQADVHCDGKHVARLEATMAVVPVDIEATDG
ncbi:MAG: PaaI family thioesterase [Acidimicrobiia bacterium]